MGSHIITRGKIVILGLLVIALFFIFTSCKGDNGSTGATGANGAPGSFATSGCADCHHLNDSTISEFNETFVSGLAGSDKTISGGTATTVSFDATKLPAGQTAQSFLWTRTNGEVATISAPTTSVTLVTLPTVTNYKAELVRHVKGLLVTTLTGTVLSDRTQLVAVNPLNFSEASSTTLKLRVATTSGNFYFALVNVNDSTGEAAVAAFAAVNTGTRNVPINVPVLLRAKTAASYNWSLTSNPTGTATMIDPATQLPSFTPDVAAQYIATEAVSGATITVYAGTWRGEITGVDAGGNVIPDTNCTACHNSPTYVNATTAPDKFTPWAASGHSHIFTKNLNAGGHYGPDCFPCHTVGFNTSASAVNNGFDDQANYATFIADTSMFSTSADPTRYSRMWNTAAYSALARETNIQCENCHGPQNSAGHATNPVPGGPNSPRTTMSADLCGSCHGEPARHGRFQQWEDSGHGNYELAVEEGMSANCAGCHSAQGFMIWLKQLQAGDPRRGLTSPITWTADTVQPQTCAVCHDPHAEGTSSGDPNTATVRVMDNTPKLPAGFIATGVGRGAICIICHNSRNGGSGNDSFLHQDGDPVFGTLTSYSGPHEACQGDVLMGKNAYFVGNGDLRSPHSIVIDTCANCHMEKTPPPELLSYNLSGTNHSFRASLDICGSCHGVNTSLGPMLQTTVKSTLEALQVSIGNKIISRNTGTPIALVVDLGSRGSVDVIYTGTNTVVNIGVGSIPGLDIPSLGTDDLAKALWNYYLIKLDLSFGVHNPDFTFGVLGASQFAVDSIPNTIVPSNEL
jgi:hypothetical protein